MKKKILVTAGSTWTFLDKVRVITNVFTGKTGFNIASYFASKGADVTLAYNPKVMSIKENDVKFRLRHFVTFDNLKEVMKDEIGNGSYDVVVHSAAVSDYGTNVRQLIEIAADPSFAELLPEGAIIHLPVEKMPGKMKSNLSNLTLLMGRTEKLVDLVKVWDPSVLLVKFKLEVGTSYEELCEIADFSLKQSKADLLVANDLEGSRNNIPPAMIVDGSGNKVMISSRKDLPHSLAVEIEKIFEEREV